METNSQNIGSCELDLDKLELRSGIYFLFNNDDLVYIGQASNITRRILEHITEGTKIFNKVRYNIVPCESLNDVETTLIRSLKPCYNVAAKNGPIESLKPSRRSCVTMRPVALMHHMRRKTGTIPVRIRVCYQRRYIYIQTNLFAYPEDVDHGTVVNKDILKDLEPILKKCKDSIKYISSDKTFEYVRNKLLSINF